MWAELSGSVGNVPPEADQDLLTKSFIAEFNMSAASSVLLLACKFEYSIYRLGPNGSFGSANNFFDISV